MNCSVIQFRIEGDIDECNLDPPSCKWNTICTNTIGSHYCKCKPDYDKIGTDPNEPNKELCIMKPAVFSQPIHDYCNKSNPCARNAECFNTEKVASCKCFHGYVGDPFKECIRPEPSTILLFKGVIKFPIAFLATLQDKYSYSDDYNQATNGIENLLNSILMNAEGYINSSAKLQSFK